MEGDFMREVIAAFADWLQNTRLALNISGSNWAYPFVQLVHFTGLSLWLGTTIVVDLHLLGIGNRTQTAAQLSKALIIWNWIGFCVVITGGFLLFSSAAGDLVVNPAFEVKIGALFPVALLWHIIVQLKTRTWGREMEVPKVAQVAGLVEILLWVCVVTAAATIPYF
jgi:hypothetical protein